MPILKRGVNKMPKVFASVDIGSNAVRLLFANVYVNASGEVVPEKATLVRMPVRLGMDVFETGSVSAYRQQLLIKTLQAFKLLIEVYGPIGFRACATAAMREASNRQEVLDTIRKETGFNIEVIDGHEEARLISTCNSFDLDPAVHYNLYIDVGGGSTELSLIRGRDLVASESFNIGTIRLMNGKVDEAAWIYMKEWIKSNLPLRGKINCIGSGGNINKLVKLFGGTSELTISRKKLKGAYELLCSMSVEERGERYGMRSDRADVIVPAAEIFLKIMKWGKISKVTAPKFGLADGLAIEQFLVWQAANKSRIS
jgi:exopolyphosphatase / guanosine-5'-triphosphate,3'-diphosphate pyrophosphatase